MINLPKNLVEDLILPIFLEKESGIFVYEFDAKLIKKVESWRTETEPYPYIENVNIVKECWLVEVVNDKFLKGKQFVRWIPRFHSTGLIHIQDYYDEEE